MTQKLKVIIRCLVYNHEPYLRDCLEGFVMQKTNFAFKAVVHDDCSTDGSAAIIREYAEKYPDIIEPIYETENLYSKRNGSLRQVMDAATMNRSDYIAYCEGDDYWIDPHKLQKQVDYMDAHPECTMVCTNAHIEAPKGILTEEDLKNMGWYHYNESRIMATEDIITKGGWFIHTCTTLYRANIKDSYPEECQRCHVGDYPLQIFAALKGSIYYMHEKMAVYRYMSVGSWTEKDCKMKEENANILPTRNILKMLSSLDNYSKKYYHSAFIERQIHLVSVNLNNYPHQRKEILKSLGWVLRNNYLTTYFNDNHTSFLQRIKNKIKLIFTWPYHPHFAKLVLPKWHPLTILNELFHSKYKYND